MIESKLRGMNSGGGGVIDFVGGVSLPAGYAQSGSFYYSQTAGGYVFDVTGVEAVNFAIMSGRGGNTTDPARNPNTGGLPGWIVGSIDLSAINSIYVLKAQPGFAYVAGYGGYTPALGGLYGGGQSGTAWDYGNGWADTHNHRAGGGGASFISTGTSIPTSSSSMIVVPGAGGGQGYKDPNNGGAGGGANMPGTYISGQGGKGGQGGTLTGGGAPAANDTAYYLSTYATAGGFLSGGKGRSSALDQGGGGGSGWYGGGGGAGGGGYSGGGGGGGSGYADLSIVSVTWTGTGASGIHTLNSSAAAMKYSPGINGINLPGVPTDGSGYVAFWN